MSIDSADVGAIVHSIVHDVRGPLHALRLALGVLAGDVDPTERKQLLGTVERSINKVDRQVQAVALAADLESRVMSLSPSAVDLDAVWWHVADECSSEAEKRGVTIEIHPSGLNVIADRARLHQAAMLLVDNAIRHSVKCTKIALQASSDPSWVILAVSNNGDACVPETRWTQPFWRRGEKRGVGLSIVHGIAHAHGGSVQLSRNPEGGICAEVKLPVRLRSVERTGTVRAERT